MAHSRSYLEESRESYAAAHSEFLAFAAKYATAAGLDWKVSGHTEACKGCQAQLKS